MRKRTPQVAEITGKRAVAKCKFRSLVKRLRRYCEAEALDATPAQQDAHGGNLVTRSSIGLLVPVGTAQLVTLSCFHGNMRML